MTWTTEKPTRPGWYWWRDLPEYDVRMLYVVKQDHELFAYYVDNMDLHLWTSTKAGLIGEWAGPLAPPE